MTFHSVCQPLNVYGWHSPLDSFFHFFCWVDNKKEIGKSNRTTNPFGYFTSFSPLLQDDTTTRRRKERDSRTSFLFSAQSRQLFVSLHLIGPNVQGNDDGPAVVDANNFFFFLLLWRRVGEKKSKQWSTCVGLLLLLLLLPRFFKTNLTNVFSFLAPVLFL